MGEARKRKLAMAWGQPWKQDLHRCPKCRSHRTSVAPAPPMAMSKHVPTPHGLCLDCGTFWEAYPDDWKGDVCEAEPCDNCAFRPGSPEIQDTEEWKSMLVKLRMGQEFRCHKGAPILVDAETKEVSFDEPWVNRHGRMCAGFAKAMQRWPDWLDNRYSVGHVLTKHDQDKLIGGED